MDDRELAAYRAAYRHLLSANAESPPSDDELAALVTGELDDAARDRVLRQMLGSHEAIEKHKILQQLHRQQVEKRRPPRRSWPRVAGVAAVLVVAFSVWQFAPPEWQEPAQRGGHLDNAGHAGTPGGNVTLDAAPHVYQWTAEAGARRYRIEVFDDDARGLWQSEWTTATQIPAPADNELTLPNSERYFWVVEIDGSTARRSLGPYWFRIK